VSAASGPPPPAFPPAGEYARKFFGEAVRHLEDASILHSARRYPAAISCSMKAVELAIKAVLILEGSLGWWEKLQQTHQPLTDIEKHPVHKYHFEGLQRHSPSLVADVKAIEKLAPARPGAGPLTLETQANTEYPFFYVAPTSAGGPDSAHLVGPSEYFTETESESHYRTAHELLTAYRGLYAAVTAWGFALPGPL
jgi:AbiV